MSIDGVDPVQIVAGQLLRCEFTLLHERLQGIDIVLGVIARIRGGVASRQDDDQPQADEVPANGPACSEDV